MLQSSASTCRGAATFVCAFSVGTCNSVLSQEVAVRIVCLVCLVLLWFEQVNASVEFLATKTLVETVEFEDALMTVAMSHKLQAAFDCGASLRSIEVTHQCVI